MRELGFNQALIDLFNDVRYNWRVNAVVLGGTSGSGGGYGAPPGGFVGQLPQVQVTGDTDELRVISSGSVSSLVDNLNRMRYWLTNQISGTAPSTTFAGQIWVDGSSGSTFKIRNESDTAWITVSGGGSVTLDPSSPQDVGSSAVVGTSGSASHGDHAHRGVSSVSAAGGLYAYGNVQLVAGTNINLSQTSGSITITNSLGAGGIVFDTSSPQDVGSSAAVGTSGSPPHADHIHRGVSSVSAGGAYAYGNVQFLSGTGIALAQSSGSITVSSAGLVSTMMYTIDGGGSTITTGIKGDLVCDFACTITGVTTLADTSGSITIDIWKQNYASYPPTVSQTITASAKPTISGTKAQDTTLTGWTTSISAGDILRFNVDSCTNITRCLVALKVVRT